MTARSDLIEGGAGFTGPRRFELREVPLPEPGPGEVRVRLEGSEGRPGGVVKAVATP